MGSKLTPLMSQYREIKNRYKDGILFFQVGDFYETFYDDAKEISRILNITLTTRDKDKKNPIPLAGVPIHAVDAYIAKLLRAGRKVIVCDQTEESSAARGIVKRNVTDIITPGTALSPATLTESENNFVIALIVRNSRCGFALLDVSTGSLSAGEEPVSIAENMLTGYTIREAIIPEGADSARMVIGQTDTGCSITELEPYRFGEQAGEEMLKQHFQVENLSCFGIEEKPLAVTAAGALLGYVRDLRQNDLKHITGLKLIVSNETLFLDTETLRNLEIFEPLRGNSPDTTVVHHLDRTETPLGARELRSWLTRPLRNLSVIEKRLDAITAFRSDQITLRELKRNLKRFPDIERLLSRITTTKAGPRDLLSLGEALRRTPGVGETLTRLKSDIIADAAHHLARQVAARELIAKSIEPDCPSHLREGGVIKRGFDERLDELITDSAEGKKWIAALQETERKRTKIPSLKVGYNKVFGYYIEASRVHDDKIPDDYICKQTLVSSQRYVTKELKEREQTILTAESKRIELEKEIFSTICDTISVESAALQDIARAVAVVDVLSSLADLALECDYCRPEVNNSDNLVITEGRHPVVEIISEKSYIPNDLIIRPDEKQVLIITGPNMGGKSTYIRQAAIISILAHMGSYVPASRAVVGIMDRIFTRVGSSDNLAMGKSTFMVEMGETAKILHNCTSKSLVLLDEVGRGTSTLDGLSIAWAVTEFLLENDGRRPKTLFATHYHELTHLSEKYSRVQNLQVEVKDWGNSVIFLYKIRPGASDKSYGIHVASLAGLPEEVIVRANEILESLEEGEAKPKPTSRRVVEQTHLFKEIDPLRDKLKAIDIDTMTPLEAIRLLAELHEKAKGK